MVCHSCERETPEDAVFCPYCGVSMAWSPVPSAVPDRPSTTDDPLMQSARETDEPLSSCSWEDSGSLMPDPISPVPDETNAEEETDHSVPEKASTVHFTTQYGTYQTIVDDADGRKRFSLNQDSSFARQLRSAWQNFPRRVKLCFTAPQELQQELEVSRDYATGLMISLPLLLAVFLCFSFSFRTLFLRMMALLGGRTVNGLSYLYGGMITDYVFGFGGVSVIAQLVAMMVGSGFPMLYLFLFEKQSIQPEKVFSFLSVLSLPTLGVSLLGLIFSFFAPVVTAVLAFLGFIYSSLQQFVLLRHQVRKENQANDLGATLTCLVSVLAVLLLNGMIFAGSLRNFPGSL